MHKNTQTAIYYIRHIRDYNIIQVFEPCGPGHQQGGHSEAEECAAGAQHLGLRSHTRHADRGGMVRKI